MLTVNHAVLHSFDFATGRPLLSARELDLSERPVRSYVQRHLRKASRSPESRHGAFSEGSALAERLVELRAGRLAFLELAQEIGEWFWEELRQTDDPQPADLLVAEFEETPDARDAAGSDEEAERLFEGTAERRLAVLVLPRRQAFLHDVGSDATEVVRSDAVLPSPTQKVDSYAVVSLDSLAIDYLDHPRTARGEERNLLADGFLQCRSRASSREVIEQVADVAAQVASEAGMEPSVAAARAKAAVVRSADLEERVEPVAVGRAVFEDEPEALERYEREVQERDMPEEVSVRRGVAARLGRSQRIRTDTGVEITFPTELAERGGCIDFVAQEDGRVSIVIRGVARIERR